MTHEQFIIALAEEYDRNLSISKAKNVDYTNTSDPFSNFQMIEKLTNGSITTEQGIITRLTDKISRIIGLLAKGGDSKALVKDEKIGDTISDACNYLMILKVYLNDKNK